MENRMRKFGDADQVIQGGPGSAGFWFDSVTDVFKINPGTAASPDVKSFSDDALAVGDRFVKTDTVALVGNTLAAGPQAWQNPETGAVIVTRVLLNITTESTGASTFDVGVTATSATTSSDTLLDGVSGAAVALFDSMNAALDSGANAKAQLVAAGKWITFTEASGAAEGLVGTAYIQYVKV